MMTLDESTLIAYVDGELDMATAREVEAKLAEDKAARQYVEHLRALAALTRVAFNDTLHEAVPQHLKDAAMGRTLKSDAPHHAEGGAPNVVSFAPRPSTPQARYSMPGGLAAAAAVAFLVLGLGGGYTFSESSNAKALQLAALSQQQDENAMNGAINKALEVNASGSALTWTNPDTGRSASITPIGVYQDKTGQFCRDYRKDVTTNGQTTTTFGLACRDGQGSWKTRYLILEDGSGQAL